MKEPILVSFLYSLEDQVRWTYGVGMLDTPWQVIQQRLTITLVMQLHEYMLISVTDPGHAPVWAYEADLTPWHVGHL